MFSSGELVSWYFRGGVNANRLPAGEWAKGGEDRIAFIRSLFGTPEELRRGPQKEREGYGAQPMGKRGFEGGKRKRAQE